MIIIYPHQSHLITAEQLVEGAVFLIDKPLNWTSFDVVNKLRYRVSKLCGKRAKVGHAGTLDPLATGLLILCVGKMTKQIQQFQDEDKEYAGTIKLGAATPSYDAETEEISSFPTAHLTPELLQETTAQFIGDIAQLPPMFSAIKVDGTPLYKLARKGEEIELKTRPVSIYSFDLTDIALPNVDFLVRCSKGTYIRSLAHDFGKALHNGGYLTGLRRTKSGGFSVDNAWQLDDLIAAVPL
jgi:tRNA pseudouridine55 synthase